mgnify:CR=1 FL=1
MANVQTKSFQVGNATFGDGRLTIIAGPCVIESREHALMMARECLDARAMRDWISFSSLHSTRPIVRRSKVSAALEWKRVWRFCGR